MPRLDWQELYASNQAAIARARTGAMPTPKPARAPAPAWAGTASLVHVPAGLDATAPVPLVCMLHGCTQSPSTFAAATLINDAADRHGFVVVYPGQDRRANPQCCWNWFLPEHQRRGAGEPAVIATSVREVIDTEARCTIDPRRVFVAGLSSGGAMAMVLAACYPDVFAALAVHSGLPYRSAHDVSSAFEVMARGTADADAQGRALYAAMGDRGRAVPSIVIHGTADHTVAPANAVNVLGQSMMANRLASPETCDHDVSRPTESRYGRVERGHAFTHSRWVDSRGELMHELLQVHGLGHAWSGGAVGGSHTDPHGPSATEAIWAFFARCASDDLRSAPALHRHAGSDR